MSIWSNFGIGSRDVYVDAYSFGMRFRNTIRSAQYNRNLPRLGQGTNHTQNQHSTNVTQIARNSVRYFRRIQSVSFPVPMYNVTACVVLGTDVDSAQTALAKPNLQ